MNENVKQAREDAKRSHKHLEEALSRLGNEIEDRVAKVADVAEQTKDFAEKINMERITEIAKTAIEDLVGYSLVRAREGAEELLEDLSKIAETQIQKLNSRPVLTWAALLAGGFTAGFLIAKNTGRLSSTQKTEATEPLDSPLKENGTFFAGNGGP
jgi:hypothetical protein